MNAVANGALRQGEAILPRVFGPFETEAVLAYASASADDNPLHVDPALAARVGLARPPIHGMLAMGCLEAYLRDWRSDLSSPASPSRSPARWSAPRRAARPSCV